MAGGTRAAALRPAKWGDISGTGVATLSCGSTIAARNDHDYGTSSRGRDVSSQPFIAIFLDQSTPSASRSVTVSYMTQMTHIDRDRHWLDANQTAILLGVSPRTVRRLVVAREIAHNRVGGQIRIAREDADHYIRRTRISAVS